MDGCMFTVTFQDLDEMVDFIKMDQGEEEEGEG